MCTVQTLAGPVPVCSQNYFGVPNAPCLSAPPNSCTMVGGPAPPFSCRPATFAGATFATPGNGVKTMGAAPTPVPVIARGGGSGGGYSRLNEFLLIKDVRILSGGYLYHLPTTNFYYKDTVTIKAVPPLSIEMDVQIDRAKTRQEKIESVLANIGPRQITTMADKDGKATLKWTNIQNVWAPSDWGRTLVFQTNPIIELAPPDRGNTYNKRIFLPNPTFNIDLIGGAPGAPIVQVPAGPPLVTYNDVPVSGVIIPGAITGAGTPTVGFPTFPQITPTPAPGIPTIANIPGLNVNIIPAQPWTVTTETTTVECLIDCNPKTGMLFLKGPPECLAESQKLGKIDCTATATGPGKNTQSYDELKKKCCPTTACGVSCEFKGGRAHFTYSPSPPCPGPFDRDCNDVFTESSFYPPGVTAGGLNSALSECCQQAVGCEYDCDPSTDGKTFLLKLIKGTSPPCAASTGTFKCSDTITGVPGWEALKEKCCNSCSYDCEKTGPGKFKLITKGASPPCVKAEGEIDCKDTLTGIPGWEDLKKKCCAPPCGLNWFLSCDKPYAWLLTIHVHGAPPGCPPDPEKTYDMPCWIAKQFFGKSHAGTISECCPECPPYDSGFACDKGKDRYKWWIKYKPPGPGCNDAEGFIPCDTYRALDALAKALGVPPASLGVPPDFDVCCGKGQPNCIETSIPGPCSFDPICEDKVNKQSFRATPDELKQSPFRKWVHQKGVGTKPPCPYDKPCAFNLPCDCGDMLKMFGPCDSPLLNMFAGLWNMDAFFTKMICCPACKDGDKKGCYTGPAGTRNVGICKDGTETCNNGQWGACMGQVTPGQEICGDNLDNNCNGAIDENCQCNNDPPRPCGPQAVGQCKQGMQFCENNIWSDCRGAIMPTSEICGDNIDNDCNGKTDETCPSPFPTPVPPGGWPPGGQPPPSTFPPNQPPGPLPPGFPPIGPSLPPAGPPTVNVPSSPPSTSTTSTSVSAPGVSAVGTSLSSVPEKCIYVQGSAAGVDASSGGQLDPNFVPKGYELIDKVQVTGCNGQRVWVTRSISNIWNDVHVIACKGNDCQTVSDQDTSQQMKCGGVEVGDLFTPQLTNRAEYMELQDMTPITGTGKEVTENDPSISAGLYKFEFTTRMPGIVELSSPTERIELPANSCIGASGTPIIVKVAKRHAPMPVIITMPVTILKDADPSTYSIYVKDGAKWFELGGKYDANTGTIAVTLEDITQYLDADNKAMFLVAGLTCHALKESCVVMHDANNDEATLLVHGFTSTIDTWWPLVKEAVYNNEKYDWVGYQFPETDTIETAAVGFRDCLNTLGKYKKVNIVAHSVGATIALRGLELAYKEKEKYTVINNVDKVITLGLPNNGIDVKALAKFADFLANHRTLARAFDRDSAILGEITTAEWQPVKNPNPPWARFIAIAGTEHCDYLDWLFSDTFAEPVGQAITVPESVQRFVFANDCLITVQNAISYLDKAEACKNMFTPYAWHPKLNDRWDMRKLIMYLLNAEKAKANPTQAFDGINQYVSWQDMCTPGKTYAIVGKRGTQQLPLYCNCGNNVCETNLGEDAISCPSDCKAWAVFLCVAFENVSNLLLLLFAVIFIIYLVRKYVISKEPPLKAWRLVLAIILIVIFILLLLIWWWCHRLPLVSWAIAIILAVLFGAEVMLGKKSAPPQHIGKKAQQSYHSEHEKAAVPPPPKVKDTYVPDEQELEIDKKLQELKKRLKNL